jgi:hypothetical protein
MQALMIIDRVHGWRKWIAERVYPTSAAVQSLQARSDDLATRLAKLEQTHRDVNVYYMQTIGSALNDRIDIASAGMRERHETFTDIFAAKIDHITEEMKRINDANAYVTMKLDAIRAKLRGLSED